MGLPKHSEDKNIQGKCRIWRTNSHDELMSCVQNGWGDGKGHHISANTWNILSEQLKYCEKLSRWICLLDTTTQSLFSNVALKYKKYKFFLENYMVKAAIWFSCLLLQKLKMSFNENNNVAFAYQIFETSSKQQQFKINDLTIMLIKN